MKKVLFIFPILFSSSCSSVTSFEDSDCLNIKENYINNNMTTEYNKEKSLFLDMNNDDHCGASTMCAYILTNSEKWEFIEVKLKANIIGYPKNDGIYKLSRDYSFKNCSPDLYDFAKNEKTDKNKEKYCVKSEKVSTPISNIHFYRNTISNKEQINKTVINIENTISLKGSDYGKIYTRIFSQPNNVYTCKKNIDDKYKAIFKDI